MKKVLQHITQHPLFIRLTHWEYWPFHAVYLPIYPVFLWQCIKARSLFFFSAANPTIKNGGFLMESKKEIDVLIPTAYKPTTLLYSPGADVSLIIAALQQQQLTYPVIIKPDIGGRGRGVKKIHNDNELTEAAAAFTIPFIIQPFIPYPKEIGLFYCRLPYENKGNITGIVSKEFVQVTGNGKNTIEELLQQNDRYILQLPALKKILGNRFKEVLAVNYSEVLVPYGNHARGCLFIDDSHLTSPQLEQVFNRVCGEINGFNYGRLDIRYNTWQELLEGKNFSIIELNGAGSEPTHIYDPQHSIFFAWKEIIRHWQLLYAISMANKNKGIKAMSFTEGKAMFKENAVYDKLLNSLAI